MIGEKVIFKECVAGYNFTYGPGEVEVTRSNIDIIIRLMRAGLCQSPFRESPKPAGDPVKTKVPVVQPEAEPEKVADVHPDIGKAPKRSRRLRASGPGPDADA